MDKKYIEPVINAAGKMTILGGSCLSDSVIKSMGEGASHFYLMKELYSSSGKYISRLLNVPAASVVASASSGIAQAIASVIAKDNISIIENPYLSDVSKRKIIIPKGHVVNYGVSVELPIHIGGGILVEAGYANGCSKLDVEKNIDENTAAIMYIKSHHAVQKSMMSLKEIIELGEKYQIPVIVDAAAEEDLGKYVHLGADLVIYSGTKAIGGPTSGLVVGTTEAMHYFNNQYQGLGRVMKVGKENIFGLIQAIENYISKQHSTSISADMLDKYVSKLNSKGLIRAEITQDAVRENILRIAVHFPDSEYAYDICEKLKNDNPKIFVREYQLNTGTFEIDLRDLNEDTLNYVVERIIYFSCDV